MPDMNLTDVKLTDQVFKREIDGHEIDGHDIKEKYIYRVVQKNGYPVLFWDNFGNSAPILTILSLLQAEIYGA